MQMDTPRLRLRHFTPADVEAFVAYRSDPEVARYQDWEFPLSLESARRLVRAYSRSDPGAPGWFPYAIEVKADGCVVGDVAVHRRRSGEEAELGFSLARDRQGQGYATEAVRGVLDTLFAGGLRTAAAECDVRNERSVRLLERLGFTCTGQRTVFARAGRERIGMLVFALPAERWKAPEGQ
ncbi:GNAT family N-acetyltransferase [Streptomyces arenae]|uniref:GNAT family N-acetyltransferase n=1 Tax=Streptomyces arenae TaxID=29301 RepID=UPI002659E3F3|nr:GNAT family N-acetyltransferase [Streptomyces arenae]MCG7202667.1 GNAT family N-acetyltransferase [Streptomyces arenae]